jgi:hypothetical protein
VVDNRIINPQNILSVLDNLAGPTAPSDAAKPNYEFNRKDGNGVMTTPEAHYLRGLLAARNLPMNEKGDYDKELPRVTGSPEQVEQRNTAIGHVHPGQNRFNLDFQFRGKELLQAAFVS